MSLKKNLISYSVVNIINASVPFFILPILTFYLSPEDFGKLSIIQLLFTITLPFLLVNIYGLFKIEYSKLSFEEFKIFVSSIILIPIFVFFIIQILFFIFSDRLSEMFDIPEKWIILSPIVVLFQCIPTMIPVLFQAKKQPFNYGLFKISLTILNMGLSLLFIILLVQGFEGRLYGIFYSYLIMTFFGIFFLFKLKLIGLNISFTYIKDALKFGIFLIPHSISGVVLSVSDKFFISNILGNEAVGIYSVAFQIASAVAIIMTSINQAWVPHLYEKLNAKPDNKAKRQIVIQTYKIMGFMFFVSLCFVLMISFIYQIFIDERYHSGINFAKLLVVGFMFQGFYFMVTNYIFYLKKSNLLSIITMSATIFNLILNYYLILLFGIYGVIYAMILCWFLFFIMTWILSNKIYYMPWFKGLMYDK